MKVKKLNNTHNVYKIGAAGWSVTFDTHAGYSLAILKMAQAFGMGFPYTNTRADIGDHWMFRNKDPGRLDTGCMKHLIYLKSEEQVTFCSMALDKDG